MRADDHSKKKEYDREANRRRGNDDDSTSSGSSPGPPFNRLSRLSAAFSRLAFSRSRLARPALLLMSSAPAARHTRSERPDVLRLFALATRGDVELDGLTRSANQQPSTSYSPRPATSGFASYPMARPATATGGYTAPSSETYAANNSRKLVISEGINISGEIDACNHLVVEGQVEASLKGANILDISESGVFFGSVEINECTIAGRFEGDLKVDGRLTVRSSGCIIGSLSYRELAVEAGATIEGKITPMNSKAPARSTTSTSKPANTSTSAPAKRPTDNSNELPFATKAAS